MQAAEDIDTTNQPTWLLVVEDLTSRAQYNQGARDGSVGTDSLGDAYQKALDLVLFLRRRIEESRRLQSLGKVG